MKLSDHQISFLVFLGSLFCASVLYIPAVNGKFVYDFNSWMLIYLKQGPEGILNCFGDRSPHFFYHLANYILYLLFGLNQWVWFFIFISFHALNATLLYVFIRNISQNAGLNYSKEAAFWGALLFLISPYQTEAVVWGATLHYLFTTSLIFICLLLFLKYMVKSSVSVLALLHVVFTIAIFSLEIAFVIPLMLAALCFFLPKISFPKLSWLKFTARILIPQFSILAVYFLINKLRGSSWIGHYGAEAHLNVDPHIVVPNFSKFLLKFLLFVHNYSFHYKEMFYLFTEKGWLVYAALALYIVLFGGAIVFFKKFRQGTRVAIVMFFLYALALLPVVNLFYLYIMSIEQDRYGYFPVAFFMAGLSLMVFSLINQYARYFLMSFSALSLFCLFANIEKWHEVGRVSNGLVDDFRWHDADRIFILNIADTYGGAYLFRSQPQSSFCEAIELRTGTDLSERVREVAQFNMEAPNDGVRVKIENDSTLKVSFSQYGNWWWKGGFGAPDYQTADYAVDFNEWNEYTLTLKSKSPGDKFIYQVSDKWKEVEDF